MRLSIGPLLVTIKYTYQRGKTTIYQRSVPTDLRPRYPGATIKQDLNTGDPIKVARMVAALNEKLEAEWAGLRAAPESSPKSLKAHADAFLKARGVIPGAPDNDPLAIELIADHVDNKRMRYAGGDEHLYRDADPEEYLTPVEIEAGKRLFGTAKPTLTDALELHLSLHPKRENKRFVAYQRRAFAGLISVTGDKEMASFGRKDARAYLDSALLSVKTTTVRRLIGAISSVFATYIRENDLNAPNPFASLQIAREGHDATKRAPFTSPELSTLVEACKAKDDPMRWIVALLAGTGARLAEIVGVPLDDLKPDAEVPHILLQVHPWRDIKGANGINGVKDRTVPLAGVALWAAKRIKKTAAEGQRFAFPQYTNETECRATSASAALNGWIRRLPLPHTCHELRHTMKDLLRAVQCPKEISDAITGHGKKDTGDGYGDGYPLSVKIEWLRKVAP
jgi:integrase